MYLEVRQRERGGAEDLARAREAREVGHFVNEARAHHEPVLPLLLRLPAGAAGPLRSGFGGPELQAFPPHSDLPLHVGSRRGGLRRCKLRGNACVATSQRGGGRM